MVGLTKEQLSTFEREGMLCIPDFLTPEQTAKLLAESKTLLSNCDLSTHPKTTFKTADDDHIGDKYFLSRLIKFHFSLILTHLIKMGICKLIYPKQ